MATPMTRAAFAEYVGVSRAAITIACREGRIIAEPNKKIDPDSISAHAFAEFHRRATKATGKNGTGRPVENGADDPVPPSILQDTAAGKLPIPPADTIAGQGKALDNSIKAVDLARKNMEYLRQIESVIPSDLVAMTIGRISAVMDENFRAFGERHADELSQIAKHKTPIEFAAVLHRRIDESMQAVIDTVKKDLKKLKRNQPHEQLDISL